MESLFKRINPVRRLRWSKRARLSNGVQRILSLRKQGSRGLIYQARSQGITLIELMIALGLSTVVAGAIIGIMSTGTRIWKMSTTQLTAFQSEQVMLDRMKKELEEASKIHGAKWGSIAFYRQGYSITPLSSSLASGLTSDDPYSPNWKGKIHDIVWYYYSETVGGKGAVWRKVTDGYTPSVVVSNPVIISDPNTDIKRLKFLYFNYGNYLTWLERTEPPPPPLDLYSPGVRPPPYKKVIDCNISPFYPQNLWQGISWVKGTLGDDVKLQSRSCSPSPSEVWWDDGGTLSGDGNKSWTNLSSDLVKFNPWSGKQAIKLSDSLPDEPDGGTGRLVLTGKSVPAGSDTLLKTTVAGSMSLTTQPVSATQLEITLGAKTKVIGGELEASAGSGKIIISGTTVENGAGDSENLGVPACGVPFTTTKRFSNVTGITTSGLTDEKFSDNTSAVPYITIVDPNKKVWIFTHVLLGTSYSTPKLVLLQFKTGTTWKGAYWSESREEPALDKSEDAENFGLIPKMADGTTRGVDGDNRVYMGPLPAPGGWTVLGVPAAAAGVSLEGASISGVDPNVAITIYNGLAYFDKAEVGTFFHSLSPPLDWSALYSNAGGEAITSPNAQFIQYKAILERTVPNPNPVMSESSLEHGCGGNRWIVTSSADSPGNDRWKAGSLNNVIAGEGDIKLFQWDINYGIDGTLQSYDMSGWAQRYEFALPERRFVRDKVLLTIDSADDFDASTIRVALLKEDNVNLQLVPFEQVPPGGSPPSTSHKIYVISTNGEAAGGGTQGSVNWDTSGGRLYVYYGGPGAIPPGPAYSDANFTTAFGTSVHGGTGIGQHPYDTCYLPVSVTGTKQLKANYGTYLSQPYCAPAHSIWTLPYTADAYDVRVHFTYFKTQTGDKNDTLGIYNVNSCTGLSYAAGEIIPTPTVDGLYGDTPLWLIADTDPKPLGMSDDGTGYRTPWLLSNSNSPSPNPIPPSEILLAGGAKFSFIFTGPLGYSLTCNDGWMIDRYECWTAMNPTLIQVDLTAQAGKGKNERAKTLSTKVQPPNLLFR